jgi:hypothetical protein
MVSLILTLILRRPIATSLAIATVTLASPLLCQPPHSHAQSSTPQPVLIELFTSEGCSDCPPADALLEKLDTRQPVPGAQSIVLSEHVTYWNHEGWSDPFSFDTIDEHQEDYVREFSLQSPATPQFVVDGAAQVAGADASRLAHEIIQAAAKPKLEIQISDARLAPDGAIDFSIKAPSGQKANLIAAVAENATQSQVARGENAGRTLHYVAVVRTFKEFGPSALDGRPLHLFGSDLQHAEKDGEPMRLVVFLVNHSNGHVLAVAQQTLSR